MAYTDIDKSDDYFNTVLYTGNGSTQSITGVGFQPDWVWIKARSATRDHNLYDNVRGATKWLDSHQTLAEDTFTNGLTSFDSDGFSVGNLIKSNNNSETYASWNWLASNTTASNTNGSITSTVSANTTSGFSIVSYTGTGSSATIGHGLGSTPQWIIVKNRSAVDPWMVYHHSVMTASATNKQFMRMNTSNALESNAGNTTWESVSTSTFGIGNDFGLNTSSENYIAYCFAEKKGFSKFGSYTGNGSTDGTFVYTGFKPAFVISKIYSGTTSSWNIFDNKRDGFNDQNKQLYADLTIAEVSGGKIDLLSNGFKLRSSSDEVNGSGRGYIYMAFAENPFVTSTGIPTTAR